MRPRPWDAAVASVGATTTSAVLADHSPTYAGHGLHAACRVLHHPCAELREVDAVMRRLFGQQRCRRQAWLCVDLKEHESAWLALRVVVTEVATCRATAAKGAMRGQRDIQRVMVHVRMHARGNDMPRAAVSVFRFVVVEYAGFGDNLCYGESTIAHHADGEFATWNVLFHECGFAITPVAGDFGAAVVAAFDDFDADR